MPTLLGVMAAALLAAAPATAAKLRPGYAPTPGATCGGYPTAPIGMARGFCAGIVIAPPPAGLLASKRLIHLPRTLLALPGGAFLVVDLGAWVPGKGAVWLMSPRRGARPDLTLLLTGLDMPHMAALGPDGRIYLGEMSRIVRFDPAATGPLGSPEVVVDGLPSNRLHPDRHPLTSFIFDADNALLVNVGAGTDQCQPAPADGEPCAEREGDRPHAAIWRFAYQGAGRWSQTPTVLARGLRNSMGLVRHPSGAIYQAENGVDLASASEPYDAINRIVANADYGWPYCLDMGVPAAGWVSQAKHCTFVQRPVVLLPPHGAPLDLTYYHGAMFPELAGRLLVTLHGYRATGSRILALEVDADGAPRASAKAAFEAYPRPGGALQRRTPYRGPGAIALDLTPDWDALKGVRPAGSPVGLAIAADGAIWVAEDRNGAILRIARDGS
jgi:glucose/arabinose dehydrogenase